MHYELDAGVRPRIGRPLKTLALLGALALVAVATVGSAPAQADTTLGGVSLAVSNNATSSTGVDNTATYTWQFTTATALAASDTITMTVPNDTTAVSTGLSLPASGGVYGLTGCNVSVGTSDPTSSGGSTTVTLTLADGGSGPCAVTSGTPVSVAVSGFTNTTTATTTAFETSVTTTDSGTSATGNATTGVDFAGNSTDVTVVVPESLTFTNANTTLTLLPVPGNSVPATGKVNLTVATNAAKGYSLSACVPTNDSIKNGSATIGQLASPGAIDSGVSAFGAQATVTANQGAGTKGAGTVATQDDWATGGSTYVGYKPTCDMTTDSVVATGTGPTNGDLITLTNGVSADAVQASGRYTGSIRYQVTPSY